MIDVRDGAYYINNHIEDVINQICLNWNIKLTVCFTCAIVVIAICE